MQGLGDVLRYLVRHVPAHPQDLADMEQAIGEQFPEPAPAATADLPAPVAIPSDGGAAIRALREQSAPAAEAVPAAEPAPPAAGHVVDADQYAQFLAWQASQSAGHHGDVPAPSPDQGAPDPARAWPPPAGAGDAIPGG